MNKFIALFLAAAIGFTFQAATTVNACDEDNSVQKGKNKNKSRESGQDQLNLHATLFHSTSNEDAKAPEDSAPLRVKTSKELGQQDNN